MLSIKGKQEIIWKEIILHFVSSNTHTYQNQNYISRGKLDKKKQSG
jgi:hypothetical protein